MNITFLIGNGFDINLGLRTRYTDFYRYYLRLWHGDMITWAINPLSKHWGDLELALGSMLSDSRINQVDAFLRSKARLEHDLVTYLKREAKRIDISGQQLEYSFNRNLMTFYKEFSEDEIQHYITSLCNCGGSVSYQFITFNYTEILDAIVQNVKSNYPLSGYDSRHHRINYHMGNVIHIHGSLSTRIILGIDNVSQIRSDVLRTDPNLTDCIIKPTVNQKYRRVAAAKQMINTSKYVCIYGMSLGDTDAYWWRYLVEWLGESEDRRLVLYMHASFYPQQSEQELAYQTRYWKDVLLRKCNIDEEKAVILCRQIIVIVNSRIFDLNPVVINDNDQEY